MTHRKVKRKYIYIGYITGFLFLITGILMLKTSTSLDTNEKTDYTTKTIMDNEIPVVAEEQTIIRPYIDNTVVIKQNYYNYKDDEETQKNSIIFYENTYIPSSGVCYKGEYDFDVVAILDGKVIKVIEDQNLGKIVEVEHKNNIISRYQSLSEVNVKEGDTITQTTIIGKSGKSNINSALDSHLNFELIINSQTVDPEEYYDKELGQI